MHLKSPHRSGSRAGSWKNGGFLSLLFCCTFGAGHLLDNGDKPSAFSRHKRKSNRHSRASTATASTDGRSAEKPVVDKAGPNLPKIYTSPTELARFEPAAGQEAGGPDTGVTSATPRSMPPQSPEVETFLLGPLLQMYAVVD